MVKKPWGHEVIIQENPAYTVKQIFVKKGHRLSKQYHNKKTETMIAISGSAFLELYDVNGRTTYFRYMEPFRPYFIAPFCIHRLSALVEDVVILEVSTSHSDDVVRLEDDYNRVEQKEYAAT